MRVGHFGAQVFRHQVRWVGVGADLHNSKLSLGDSLLHPEVLNLYVPRLSKALAVYHANGCRRISANRAADFQAEVREHGHDAEGLRGALDQRVELRFAT